MWHIHQLSLRVPTEKTVYLWSLAKKGKRVEGRVDVDKGIEGVVLWTRELLNQFLKNHQLNKAEIGITDESISDCISSGLQHTFSSIINSVTLCMSFIRKVDAGTDSLLDNIVNISEDNNDTFTGDGPGFIM